MKKLTVILAAAILSLVFTASVFGGEKQAAVVIEVRAEFEWNTGHLEGAVLIPHEVIAQEITKVESDKKTRILLYCKSGRRSALALDALKNAGYENVINLGTVDEAAKALGRNIVKL